MIGTVEVDQQSWGTNVNINGTLSRPDRNVVHLQAEKIANEVRIAL